MLKQILKYLSISVLSALIIIGSSGVAVTTMLCLKSGSILVTIGNDDDCCQDEQDCESIAGNCCDIDKSEFSIDHFTPSTKHKTNIDKTAYNALLPNHFSFCFQSVPDLNTAIVNNSPPPIKPFGRDLLSLISRFTI